ncbi:hypothetical protein BASA81_008433 [Batrachochytrium salamandrivorans]|nr:hypothetical protein BASA81_008433 [Batrachochytrium salamandrivorans]
MSFATGEEDDFDMFAPPREDKPTPSTHASSLLTVDKPQQVVNRAEDHSDAQGYFKASVGTILPNDLHVLGSLGQGVFSTVFLAKRHSPSSFEKESEQEFAVKILRANEVMYKAGKKEVGILLALRGHAHAVHLVEWFDLPHSPTPHLTLVFERMGMNLRETMDKFGRGVGLSLDGVRSFALQLFSVLTRLKEVGIVHADLKPDNILVSQDFRRCALGDFGSAFYLTDSEAQLPTPYLVSRFYRAPEIILGFTASPASDVWSLGTLLFELYCGQLLFPGTTNNDMLHKFHQCLGRFPKALIKRHCQVYESKLESEPHYCADTFRFKAHETAVDGKVVRRLVTVSERPEKPLWTLLVQKAQSTQEDEDDGGEVNEDLLRFSKMLQQCLQLDPAHRLDPAKAPKLDFFDFNNPNKRTKIR